MTSRGLNLDSNLNPALLAAKPTSCKFYLLREPGINYREFEFLFGPLKSRRCWNWGKWWEVSNPHPPDCLVSPWIWVLEGGSLQSGNKADAKNGIPEPHCCKRFMQTIDISRSNVMDVLYLVQPTTVCGRSVLVQICYCLMLDLVTFVDKSSLLQQEARVVWVRPQRVA